MIWPDAATRYRSRKGKMRIGIYSTMAGMPWGGSEELWSRAASVLLRDGHEVLVNYKRRKEPVRQLEELTSAGARVHLRRNIRLGRGFSKAMKALRLARQPGLKWLKEARPEFVLISVGFHIDETSITQTLRDLRIPYAMLVQSASPYHWIEMNRFAVERAAYAGATRCFFVSKQNQAIVENNLALDLADVEIVDNPFQVPLDSAPAWPSCDKSWKLACVARVHFQSKAQDLLLAVLRQPKWRNRPVELHCWGSDGGSMQQAKHLVALHGQQKQVFLHGFTDNVESVWRDHHALVLPSRFEGNALAMIEAMLCGRMPIVTNVGRVSELVDDGASGFVAPAATFELVDDALERAWERRQEWQAMGARAAQTIRQRHSMQPAEDFAAAVIDAAAGRGIAKPRVAA
jgi:glycosyltransferase involved in cell wall biosynthesis